MQTNTMTSRKSSGCGCSSGGSGASKGGSCGCGGGRSCSCGCVGKGCSVCEAPPEAYSRPQFFGGQLLTEDDLQSMVDYTVAKNRLHNRMLFGEGVACGLGVSKDVCEPLRRLTVRPGYAIDCCGNDIVVPCEATLDVVQLIRDLRARTLGKDCGDPCPPPDNTPSADIGNAALAPGESLAPPTNNVVGGVGNPVEVIDPAKLKGRNSYCLYVVYCEHPSDPVAPYDGADTCGGGDCCHTRVREGFRFELRCATPSGCEPQRKQIDPNRIYMNTDTARAEAVFNRLKLVNDAREEDRGVARDVAIQRLKETISDPAGAFDTSQTALISEASRLKLDDNGITRFNTIVAILLISWLLRGDCKSLLFDCPPCDADGVLLACFDFENCKISNLCAQSRIQILSPGYFAQLGLTQLWRCMRIAACCRPDKDAYTVSGIKTGMLDKGQIAGNLRAQMLMAERRAGGAVTVERADDDGISIEELQDFLKARVARIDNPNVPEYQATLLPDLLRAFDSEATRAPADAEDVYKILSERIDSLQAEIDRLQNAVDTFPKPRGTKGDRT